jgi:hypothetical protein
MGNYYGKWLNPTLSFFLFSMSPLPHDRAKYDAFYQRSNEAEAAKERRSLLRKIAEALRGPDSLAVQKAPREVSPGDWRGRSENGKVEAASHRGVGP